MLRDLLRAVAPGAGAVPRPQEQELADLFLEVAQRADAPSVLTLDEDRFVALAQEVILGETEELRMAAMALHQASRSTLDATSGDGEIWLDATSRRALEGLGLLGRQWVRLIAEKQADSGARTALAQGPEARAILDELDRLLDRHEMDVLVRRLADRPAGRLRDLVDSVRIAARAEPRHLETLLEIAVEVERQAEVGFTALLADPEQWRKACRRAEGLSLRDLTTGDCQGRLKKLAEVWARWQAGRPAGDRGGDGGNDVTAFAAWLKDRFFLYRVLLLETGAAEAPQGDEESGTPVSLHEETLRPALARLHGRLREVATPATAQDAESAARALATALLARPEERVATVRDFLFPESGGSTEREALRELFDVAAADAVDEPLLARLIPAAERALARADLIAGLLDGVLLPWPDAASAMAAEICLGTALVEPGIASGEIQASLELLIGLRPTPTNGASEPCGAPWLRAGIASPPLRFPVSLDGAAGGARQAFEASLAVQARQAAFSGAAPAGLHAFVGRAGVPVGLPLGGASFAWDRGLRLEVRGECVEILPPSVPADAACEGTPLAGLTSAYALREPAERLARRILVREAGPRLAELLAKEKALASVTAEALEDARAAVDASLRDPARPLVCSEEGCGVRAPLPGPGGRLGDSTVLVRISANGVPDLAVEVGAGDALAAALGAGGPLSWRRVEIAPDGAQTAEVVLTDGRRDLLPLGRMTVRQGTVEIQNQVVGRNEIGLGGGFRLAVGSETHFAWKPAALEISGVRLSGPRPFGTVDGLKLTATRDSGGLRWELDDASATQLGAAVRSWLAQVGLWPPGLAPGVVSITPDGLRLDFFGVPEPLRACAASLATAPLDERWIASLPERLRGAGVCAGGWAAAELDGRLLELRKLLEKNLAPRADVWRFGEKDLSPLGSVRWKCDESGALAADAYGSCVIEIRSAALACGADADLTVEFAAAGGARVDFPAGRECLAQILTERLGGVPALEGEVQARYVRQEHQVALTAAVRLAGMAVPVELRIGLDGGVQLRVEKSEELARAVESVLEEARAELRRQIDLQDFDDVGAAVEAWRKDLEQELGATIEVLDYFEEIPEIRTGASVRICHPGLVGGPPVCASGVRLSLAGKVFDFSRAEMDPAALEATLRGLLPGVGGVHVVAVVPARDTVTVIAENRFLVDPFPQPLVAEVRLQVGREGVAADVRADLLEPLVKEMSSRIDKLALKGDGWNLSFTSAETQGDDVVLHGKARLADLLGLDFDLRLPVLVPGRAALSVHTSDLTPLIQRELDKLVGDLELPDLPVKLRNAPELLPGNGPLPRGVRLELTASLFGQIPVSIPEVLIDGDGVRLGGLKRFSFELPKDKEVPVTPFALSRIRGALEGDQVTLGADVSASQARKAARLEGEFAVDLRYPLRWTASGELVVVDSIELGRATATLDLEHGSFDVKVSLGGKASAIVRIDGHLTVKAQPDFRFTGKLEGRVFSVPISSLQLEITESRFLLHTEANLRLFGSVSADFTTRERFRDPTLSASGKLEILGIDLARPRVSINPRVADFGAKALGLSIHLVVPYGELDEELIAELLKRLLSPDLKNLHKALEAILTGNITINPFADFGVDDGGVDGDGGDNDGDGPGGGDPGAGGYGELDRVAQAAGEGDLPEGAAAAGSVQEDGGTAAVPKGVLMKDGDQELWIHQAAGGFTVHRIKAKVSDSAALLTLPGDDAVREQLRLVPGTDLFTSKGKVLVWGGDPGSLGFFLHALDHENGAVLYAFAGSGAAPAAWGRLPLKPLELTYSGIDALAQPNGAAIRGLAGTFKLLLADLPFVVRDGSSVDLVKSAFRFHVPGDSGLTALCVRYRGEDFHTVYVSEHSADKPREGIVLLGDLQTLDLDKSEDREILERLLRNALATKQTREQILSKVDGRSFLVAADGLHVWKQDHFEKVPDVPAKPGSGATAAGERLRKAEQALRDAGQQDKEAQRQEETDEKIKVHKGKVRGALFGNALGGTLRIVPVAGDPSRVEIFVGDGNPETSVAVAPRKLGGVELFAERNGALTTTGMPLAFAREAWGHAVDTEPPQGKTGRGRFYWHSRTATGSIDLADLGLDYAGLSAIAGESLLGTALRRLFFEIPDFLAEGKPEIRLEAGRLTGGGDAPFEIILVRLQRDQPWSVIVATPLERSWVLALRGMADLINDEARGFAGSLALSLARRGKSSAQVFPAGKNFFVLSEGDFELWEPQDSEGDRLGEIRVLGSGERLRAVDDPQLSDAFAQLIRWLDGRLAAEEDAVFAEGFVLRQVDGQPAAAISVRVPSQEDQSQVFVGGAAGRQP
jgi:hypothetical protein